MKRTLVTALLLAAFLITACATVPPAPVVPSMPRYMYADPPSSPAETLPSLRGVVAAPQIQGRVFYDANGNASPGSPSCDRGQRGVTVSLFSDANANGVVDPGSDPLLTTATTDIIGDYEFGSLAAPATYLVSIDPADPHLPAGSFATTPNPLTVALAAGQTKTAHLGVHIRDAASPRDVVLNEIAWMGTTASLAANAPDAGPETATDEWIELRNVTARTIDLTGWTLRSADGDPAIALAGRIPPGGHYLLERTDDNSAAAATADQIYTGGLNNGGEDLTLSDGLQVIDRVDAWYAGNNTTKQTMQRADPTLPGTSPAAWQNGPVNGDARNSLVDLDNDSYVYSPNPIQAIYSADCNDGNGAVHPGAVEVLDFVDNDCNGAVDDGLLLEPLAVVPYFNSIVTATGPVSCPTPADNALIGLIDGATQTVDVAIYGFDRATLRDALVRAHQRGVRVRMMGDDEAYNTRSYKPFYQSVEAAGIPVLYDMRGPGSIEHNKFAVIDGTTVWTGSMNWTDNGVTYNSNNALAIDSRHLAQTYTTEFEEMFDPLLGHDGVCKQDNTTHDFNLGGTNVESYFSPSDHVEDAILSELGSATESIYFVMFFMTSDPVGDMLMRKAITDGLSVNGIYDAVGAANPYSEHRRLCAAGVPVKVETYGGKAHHKFAVIDVNGPDPRVITGSYNWTSAGSESNDENTLVIHDASLAQAYYQEYLRLSDALPASTVCSACAAESGPYACYDGLDNDFDGTIDMNDSSCRSAACNDLTPLGGRVFGDENSNAVFDVPDVILPDIDVTITRQVDRLCEGMPWVPAASVASSASGYSYALHAGTYRVAADLSDPDVPPRGAVATTDWTQPLALSAGTPATRDIGLMACPWDLNRDGEVDVEDVQRVAAHWNTQQGDASYVLLADVDKNGVIDLTDVSVPAAAWGSLCP